MKIRMRRLPRAATLLRVMALAVALTAAAASHAQQCDIRINGGSVTANGGDSGTTCGDAMGGGTLTVSAPTYVTVKAGDGAPDAQTFVHGGTKTLTDWLNGKIYANFELTEYQVSARIHKTGWGTVTGTGAHEYGSTVTLTAAPSEQQYVFIGWFTDAADSTLITSEASMNYTVAEGDTTFVAVFANEVKVTAAASPADGGSVTVTSDQEPEPGAAYDPMHTIYGSHVTVKATANEGWAFKGWYDADTDTMVSGTTSYTFEATKDTTLEARFTDAVIYVRVRK